MIRSISFYFHKGRQKQRRYFKRNLLGLFCYAFYALAGIVGSFLCIGFPLFSSSGYNVFRMLDETDDAYISKSFDGGDDRKHYLPRFLYAFFIVILMGITSSVVYLFTVLVKTFFESLFAGASVEIFYWFFTAIAIALGAIVWIILLMMLQIGSYIGAKNHALSIGDIAYNSVNFFLKHGLRLFFLDFLTTLYYLIIPAIFVAAYIAMTICAEKSDDYFITMFQGIGYGILMLLIVLSPIFFGRYFLTVKMASYYLFEDGAETSCYKIVYPKKEGKKPNEEGVRGHYIEAIPLEDTGSEEPTPIEVDTKEEDK